MRQDCEKKAIVDRIVMREIYTSVCYYIYNNLQPFIIINTILILSKYYCWNMRSYFQLINLNTRFDILLYLLIYKDVFNLFCHPPNPSKRINAPPSLRVNQLRLFGVIQSITYSFMLCLIYLINLLSLHINTTLNLASLLHISLTSSLLTFVSVCTSQPPKTTHHGLQQQLALP